MLIVGGVVLAIVLVVGGVFAYKRWDENRPNTNAKYTKCVEDAKALQEKNDKIVAKVDADIEKCTRDYIKGKGYTDSIDCIQDYSNPVCESTERYNAEVNGGNECMKDRDARLTAEGYEEGIPAVDCMKYLGEK